MSTTTNPNYIPNLTYSAPSIDSDFPIYSSAYTTFNNIINKTYVDNTISSHNYQSYEFSSDNENQQTILQNNIYEIFDDLIVFTTSLDENKQVQPLETFFDIIHDKTSFDIKINRRNYYLIMKNVIFTKISNLGSSTSINKISVLYNCDDIEYENIVMDIGLKRRMKITKLMNDIMNIKK
jgi:hypothetical protein